ncbi:membrane fusion protein of tripartite multidrug resistance system [Methylacidiphilum kamchatkense Kam1]|uniref:Membrane fusion protein (Multidrug efflux system) n=1 Tax=Methylacidiphilum kamchatkense Kam1 TaxID=1202785 RepID=A0A0C1V367_9BACT|nr:efflux RND transporter periplasmic adaptor subunit [Methylacidiphilum kamchatkense]KIE58140.1 membrane fusion protein of tripartite multidrug resistance system [Methylacidiphilum kamchatkense Kam1]QDQ42169.1 membrane fusion protein (multidrug efflux system) [Methylacidiphilum kamchatkense Kam1]
MSPSNEAEKKTTNLKDPWKKLLRYLNRSIIASTPPKYRRRVIRNRQLVLVTLGILFLGLLYFILWFFIFSRVVITNDAYVIGNLVPLKSQVSGVVTEVLYENTQLVHQGEVLVRLDRLDSRVALERAEANLGETVRRVEDLFYQVQVSRNRLLAEIARLDRLKHDLARYKSVVSYGAVSEQLVDDTEQQVKELEAQVKQDEASLYDAESQIFNTKIEDHPLVKQAATELKNAYLDYVRREVYAPVTGYIANRKVQPGDEVRPDTYLLSIVPLDYLWVEANYREREMKKIRPGQPVTITVDYYGRRLIYHGQVEGLHPGTGSAFALLPPENATGNYIHIVERVPVRIRLSPEELKRHPLRPGLSVIALTHVDKKGEPILSSLVKFPKEKYEAHIYERELDGADQLIQKVIESNLYKNRLPKPIHPDKKEKD